MTHEPKVCDFCVTNILQSQKPQGYHHTNRDELSLSASQKCPFCLVLNKDVEQNKSQSSISGFQKPIYRWTIRPGGKIRESQAYIIVTFRPILVGPGSSDATTTESLKERVFYLVPEEDLGNLPSPVRLGGSTDSSRSRQRMRDWVDNCIKNHPNCNLRESGRDFVPTRLVDLGEPGAEWAAKSVRIVPTKDAGIRSHYATLSHCWGNPDSKPFFNLTKEILQASAVPSVPIEDINNENFTQAMAVARYLGVRYIWIDSMCIVQNDEGADKLRELQLMHQVYRNSHCNIAAVDSPDKSGGLFRERKGTVDYLVPTRYVPSHESGTQEPALFGDRPWRVLNGDLWQDEVLAGAVYTRAWVFQERLLSPRILHFSKNQIFWDCATLSACETMPDKIPAVLENQAASERHWRERLQDTALMVSPISGTANHSLEAFWSAAVLSYTSCNLTNQTDKLNALWGIAKLVRDALSEEYGAGFWEPELHQQLAWRVVNWEKSVRTEDLARLFPSWSWSSVNGAIEVANRMTGYQGYRVTGHDGQPLALKIKNRVYARHIQSNYTRWSDELSFMTAELAQRQAKIVSRIQEADSNSEPVPRSQPGAVLVGKAEYRNAETMPELEDVTLNIQGHISRGRMVMLSEDKTWRIVIRNPDGSTFEGIEAFPDERPETQETECMFVVLSAERFDEGYVDAECADEECIGEECIGEECFDEECVDENCDDSEDCEDRDSAYHYSGNGIIVKNERDNHYRRIGAIAFREIKPESWDALRHQCCGRTVEQGEHSLEAGTMFYLD